MALNATVYSFEIALTDADRGVHESLAFRVARHPSETVPHLLTRVLAFCLEHVQGLAFSRGGLSDPDEPALAIRDLTGALTAWIDVGLPDAGRLHKAAKAAPRVAVYSYKDVSPLLRRLESESVHRASEIEFHVLDPQFMTELGACLERRMCFELTLSDAQLYLSLGGRTLIGTVTRQRLG